MVVTVQLQLATIVRVPPAAGALSSRVTVSTWWNTWPRAPRAASSSPTTSPLEPPREHDPAV